MPPCSNNFLLLGQNIRQRTYRRDPKRIHLLMALRVVFLDMLELRRVVERRDVPVQVTQPPMDRGISGADVADVGLEVLHVYGVETHDRGVQSDISLGDVIAKVVRGRR